MTRPSLGILHYTLPPVTGGVEAVIQAHARLFVQAGYPLALVAGRGAQPALPPGADYIEIPLADSQHPEILRASADLEQGHIPADFEALVGRLIAALQPVVDECEHWLVHNVLTKHFNLPLTVALHRLLDDGHIHHLLAWCHDFTWTSPNSRSKVHPGYPWDILRHYRSEITYVVVSARRQRELGALFDCPLQKIHIVYNGVDPARLLGFSPEGGELIERLGLLASDPLLLMPVRVTQAKNIEYALQVVKELKAQHPRVKLVLTGPPDPHDRQSMGYFQSLVALRRQLGVEGEMLFVYEAGTEPEQGCLIGEEVVSDLFRACDVVFMPSHREGFGMPVLEAGLTGALVVATAIPAAEEIGREDILIIDAGQPAAETARQIMARLEANPLCRLKRRVRGEFTWQAIFRSSIEPLLSAPGGRS